MPRRLKQDTPTGILSLVPRGPEQDMAQIHVIGQVTHDLAPRKSQKGSAYVCFQLKEWTGKGRFQSYQVWAWNEDVSRLIRANVRKGSLIWLTGTQELVDCTEGTNSRRTMLLKVYLTNWGFLPGARQQSGSAEPPDEPSVFSPPPAQVLDGDREPLPE